MTRRDQWSRRVGCAAVAVIGLVTAAAATEVCFPYPYAEGSGDLADLAEVLGATLSEHPSLQKALESQAPNLCSDDNLVYEQGYFEPKGNRIVLNADLSQDMQLAVLVHEIRHLEQFGRGVCPTVSETISDYMRSRLALEADASAIGVYVSWEMREAGRPGPWEALKVWPTHIDLVARFEAVIASGGDDVAATAATYAQWFESEDRRSIYAFAICSNYLDALDRENVDAGKAALPDDFAARLCVMPDGRPYDCVLPP